jgi:hypothetical protein
MFAIERRELSRGVDGLTVVVPDDPERLPKSPGVEYTSLSGIVLESWENSNGSDRDNISREPGT